MKIDWSSVLFAFVMIGGMLFGFTVAHQRSIREDILAYCSQGMTLEVCNKVIDYEKAKLKLGEELSELEKATNKTRNK